MAIVRQGDIDREMRDVFEKTSFVIESIISAQDYFASKGEVFYGSAILKRQISLYLKHYIEMEEEKVIRKIKKKPYLKADEPRRRKKNKREKKQ